MIFPLHEQGVEQRVGIGSSLAGPAAVVPKALDDSLQSSFPGQTCFAPNDRALPPPTALFLLQAPSMLTYKDTNIVLRNMGFEEFFYIVEDYQWQDGGFEETRVDDKGTSDKARLILEAHRALMEMNEDNRAKFNDVVVLVSRVDRP